MRSDWRARVDEIVACNISTRLAVDQSREYGGDIPSMDTLYTPANLNSCLNRHRYDPRHRPFVREWIGFGSGCSPDLLDEESTITGEVKLAPTKLTGTRSYLKRR